MFSIRQQASNVNSISVAEYCDGCPLPRTLKDFDMSLSKEHLVPRSQGRRRGMPVQALPTVMLCGPCHKFLHRTFSNAELAADYPTVPALLAHPEVERFVRWVRTQPATKGVRVR